MQYELCLDSVFSEFRVVFCDKNVPKYRKSIKKIFKNLHLQQKH